MIFYTFLNIRQILTLSIKKNNILNKFNNQIYDDLLFSSVTPFNGKKKNNRSFR